MEPCISFSGLMMESKMIQKIGILTCIKSNDVCARVGCLKAFNRRSDFFAEYDGNTELAALMTAGPGLEDLAGCQM